MEAYNFPSGVIYQMHRTAAAKQPGVFTQVGLDTFIDPRLQGGRMNGATPAAHVETATVAGQEWLFFPSVIPDVAIIRATTADEYGNLTFEDEGSPWAPWTWPTPRTTTEASSSPRSNAWPKPGACTPAREGARHPRGRHRDRRRPAADHPDPQRPRHLRSAAPAR